MESSSSTSLGDLSWHVARRCQGGACVRIAPGSDAIMIGDSKHPDGPIFIVSIAEWAKLVDGIKQGDFDNLL
jgi:hypothetical protein